MPLNASSQSRDREASRLAAHLENYRTGALDAHALAAYLRSLFESTRSVLPIYARDIFLQTAKKLERGSYKVRGGKLTGNLLHLERILIHFWGGVSPPNIVGVSVIYGGYKNEYPEAEAAIDELYRLTQNYPLSPGPEDLRIVLVFMVPGSISTPGFEGSRTSSFSAEERAKAIQVAVPPGLNAPLLRRWLSGTLRETSDLIRKRVKKRYAPPSTDAAERAMDELATRLDRQPV